MEESLSWTETWKERRRTKKLVRTYSSVSAADPRSTVTAVRIADQENDSTGEHLWIPMSITRAAETRNFTWDSRAPESQIFIRIDGRFPYRGIIHVYESEVLQKPRFWPQTVKDRGIGEPRKKKMRISCCKFPRCLPTAEGACLLTTNQELH